MPRYYFHTEDGRCIEDETGTPLANLDAAKVAAQRLLGEMIRDMPEFWDTRTFRVIVRDEAGALLFTIDTCAALAPEPDPPSTGGAHRDAPRAI